MEFDHKTSVFYCLTLSCSNSATFCFPDFLVFSTNFFFFFFERACSLLLVVMLPRRVNSSSLVVFSSTWEGERHLLIDFFDSVLSSDFSTAFVLPETWNRTKIKPTIIRIYTVRQPNFSNTVKLLLSKGR